MAKKLYSDLDFQNTNRNTNLPEATADGHSTQWGQSKYAVRKNDAFTTTEFDALCTPGNDCIVARYEVNAGNFTVSGSNVTELFDLSGNGRHLRQFASPANRPTIDTTAFPGGTDANGIMFNSSSQQYLRGEDTTGTPITHDIPSYSLGVIAVFADILTGISPLFSWVDSGRTDANSTWAFRAQNGGTTTANNTTSIQIGGSINGVGPQYSPGVLSTGPHGMGIIFPAWATTSRPRSQPFRQSWHYEPQPTGNSNAGVSITIPSSFPLSGKCIFMGAGRVGSTNIWAECRLKALVVVNLASATAQVEGRKDPQAFLRRISAHYVFYNSWGQKFNLQP